MSISLVFVALTGQSFLTFFLLFTKTVCFSLVPTSGTYVQAQLWIVIVYILSDHIYTPAILWNLNVQVKYEKFFTLTFFIIIDLSAHKLTCACT
jgi:hypothetical protein